MSFEEEFSNKIAGEIVLSNDPGKIIGKWRRTFGLSSTELSRRLGVSASVVSDYESGRRKSPGAKMVKKIVYSFIESDSDNGYKLLKAYEKALGSRDTGGAILDIREFSSPTKAREICKIVQGIPVANEKLLGKELYGYTAVDSVKAILEMAPDEFLKIYGLTSERALVFTNVSTGRSPFIAIRVTSMKPGLVVLHGLKNVDPLGIKIAEREKIPVVLSKIENVDHLIEELRKNTN